MAGRRPTTTIKVSRKVTKHIDGVATQGESIDETLRRLFKLGGNGKSHITLPLTTTIKVSKVVMRHIIKSSKPEESRDHTLSRLLWIEPDDGNVMRKNP